MVNGCLYLASPAPFKGWDGTGCFGQAGYTLLGSRDSPALGARRLQWPFCLKHALSVAHAHTLLYLFPGDVPCKLQRTADLSCFCPAEHFLSSGGGLTVDKWPWVVRLGSLWTRFYLHERSTQGLTISVAQCKSSQMVRCAEQGFLDLLRQTLLTGNCWKLKVMQNIKLWRI